MGELFDVTPFEMDAVPVEILSAAQRLTRRNRALLAQGFNPATRRKFMGNGADCGCCLHHNVYDVHGRIYHKCAKHTLGESHSAASDIRVSWPACELYEPGPS